MTSLAPAASCEAEGAVLVAGDVVCTIAASEIRPRAVSVRARQRDASVADGGISFSAATARSEIHRRRMRRKRAHSAANATVEIRTAAVLVRACSEHLARANGIVWKIMEGKAKKVSQKAFRNQKTSGSALMAIP